MIEQQEPLVSDEEMLTRYQVAFGTNPDVHQWGLLTWVRDEYEAERQQLTAQVAGQWEPVEHGFEYHCQCADCLDIDEQLWKQKLYVSGNEIGVRYADESNDGSYVYVPENLRLCRLTPAASVDDATVQSEGAA